jgi:hypothetical protein
MPQNGFVADTTTGQMAQHRLDQQPMRLGVEERDCGDTAQLALE